MAYLSQLGPYLIDEELAEGGMARVFRARLRGLGGFEKTLVVKQIKPELAKDPRFVELFVREANTLVSLSHPHIVAVYELGAVEGTYYLSMEYVEGATVARMLELGPLLPDLVAHLGAQVCDALDYAHVSFGILHRDITPRNIIVDRAGHARLLDFGIAGALGAVDHDVFGSPGYMAPEQARKLPMTPASDLFALGAVLHEALTGEPTFEKTPRGTLGPRPPSDALATQGVPQPLGTLVHSMLAHDPEERPQSAAEVARQLRAYLAHARPEGVLVEMRERAQAAHIQRPSPAPRSEIEAEPVTARMEARALATSPVLTEMLRSAPGVGAPTPREQPLATATKLALAERDAPAATRREAGTMRMDSAQDAGHGEPVDLTNARATAWMLRAWPWLALLALAMALGFAWLRPKLRATQPASSGASSARQAPRHAITPTAASAPTSTSSRNAQAAERQTGAKGMPEAPSPAANHQGTPGSAADAATSPEGSASLSVQATPWAEVSIDGKSHGVTPLRGLKLRAGSHVIRLRCPPLGRESELRVLIAENARARVAVDLTSEPPRTFLDGLGKVR